MFDFIPLEYYTPMFYNILLLIIIVTSVNLISKKGIITQVYTVDFKSFFLFVFVLFYMGLRPVSGKYFADMATYANYFHRYADGSEVIRDTDLLWYYYMKFSSSIVNLDMFFLLTAFIYMLPLFIATKNLLKTGKFYLNLVFISSFLFWALGTNGMRTAVALSLLIWAFSLKDKKGFKLLLLFISYNIHNSMIIPISAFILTKYFTNNTKYFLYGWLLAIPLSLILGSGVENFIMSFGFSDDRVNSYLGDHSSDDQFSSIGFRWDFLLYSATAVFAGYYYIIKKRFSDKFYTQIFNIFLAANAFWILVIRANFSNRFASLSWVIMPIIIFYPLLKKTFFRDQQFRLAIILFLYFGFTYFMSF